MIIVAFLSLGLLGLLIGIMLAYASVKFHVEIDPLIEKIENMLPGVNCGACGQAGCNGYAAAIVNNNIPINLCAPGGSELAQELAKVTGRELKEEALKKVAFVFCKGGNKAGDKFKYEGVQTCEAAILVSDGQKICSYGCLGFGDCVGACKFAAIHMAENGVPIIDEEKCINCGACIKVCPKNLIKEVPLKEVKTVICSSHDSTKTARAACKVACIGCGLCIKNCPFDAIKLENNLAIIDPDKCTNCGVCVQKCPTKAIA